MSGQYPQNPGQQAPILRVRAGTSQADVREYRFQTAFRIGREEGCELQIVDPHVSRQHVAVAFANGQWWFRDLGSANGIFVNGQRVENGAIGQSLQARLGVQGPYVMFEVEQPQYTPSGRMQAPSPPAGASETMVMASYAEKYFAETQSNEAVGERTMMIRKAFQKVQKKQKRKYGWIVGAVGAVALAVAGYAYYAHQEMSKQKQVAQEIFYAMKSLDVDIANVERLVAETGNLQGREQIRKYLERRRQMQTNYEKFASTIKLYDRQLTEEEKLILRVTRMFGECELAAPPEYLAEVQKYIKLWQSSSRYKNAIQLAQEKGYVRKIADEFLAQNLPPQFLYLAMQESNFDEFISGPPTYKGIAKGMWQFIPETGEKYGLKIGPLAEFRRPDPMDDRHNWEKATGAAARYIKDIYSTDAQASGLLVMASYNWGEHKVIKLLQTMPANPRDRNFWKLLEQYRDKLPNETYNYVYYIVSAAVIGENPRMFGFQFDSPLAYLEAK
jgi:membrane-bound lytic murein transglycosylase D